MKLTVQQVVNIWNALNAIYRENDILPGIFDYHMKRNLKTLQVEIEQLQSLEDEQRDKILSEQITLSLSKIKPDQLPDKMPNGALELINPILLEKEQKQHKSVIEQLLKEEDKEKEEADS